MVSNTDKSDQGGTHSWSIMNISPKSELFFFDSFGIEGMKHFIVRGDNKTVGKILKEIEAIDQKDKKLTLCKLKFFNECLREASRKRNLKTFRKCSRLFSFNT